MSERDGYIGNIIIRPRVNHLNLRKVSDTDGISMFDLHARA